jgi:hypothetical protein
MSKAFGGRSSDCVSHALFVHFVRTPIGNPNNPEGDARCTSLSLEKRAPHCVHGHPIGIFVDGR